MVTRMRAGGLTWLLALSVALLLPVRSQAAAYVDVGPMIGHVSATNALVWFKGSERAFPVLELSETAEFARPKVFRGAPLQAANDYAATLQATGLKPATRYFYRL